jgi:hypothetical protein
LSISELQACRKIIYCEHIGLKKIGKCVQLDVKWSMALVIYIPCLMLGGIEPKTCEGLEGQMLR